MGDHSGIVVIGEPDEATGALYLRTLGAAFSVLFAQDEAAIVQLLRGRPVAAVVVEPALFPDDGWASLERVSRACAAARVPLVICSTRDERRRGREIGAATYLVKPTLPSALLVAIRQVIRGVPA